MLLKKEEVVKEEKLDLLESYKGLWNIVQLKSVKKLILFLLTCKVN